jgi:NAD(P)H dehydrogenase (quinone)
VNTLIVTANPDQKSLTANIAQQLESALRPGAVVVADLAAEGFDPRFGPADRETYRGKTDTLPDVVREQRRVDAADHLVLIFPVYWWSMPALMKGWIDRVFIAGWAFDIDPAGGTRRNLHGLTVHLLAVAGDAAGTYERHGYEQALRTQIEHGIVDYCGAQRGSVTFVHESEQDDQEARHALVLDAIERTAHAITS